MELLTRHLCKGGDIGLHNNMFGGIMMCFIDEAAAAYVMEICGCSRVVTVKIDEMIFKKPVKPGNLIRIFGEVKEIGNTSITLYIEARSLDVETREEVVVTQTSIKFVRIDQDGDPMGIPDKVKEKYKK